MKSVSPETGSLFIDHNCLKKASLIFRAADHSLRQKMLLFIHQNLRVNVRTIYKKLKVEQSVASHHLGILREAKLVLALRDGKHVFYSINYEKLKNLHSIAGKMIQ